MKDSELKKVKKLKEQIGEVMHNAEADLSTVLTVLTYLLVEIGLTQAELSPQELIAKFASNTCKAYELFMLSNDEEQSEEEDEQAHGRTTH